MTVTVGTLVGLLAFWMALCSFCGLKGRYIWFLAVLFLGLGVNLAWMVFGLDGRLSEDHVWVAMASATVYALCAFWIGRFAGRIRQAWVDSRVPPRDSLGAQK